MIFQYAFLLLYRLGNLLGSGQFGTVYRGVWQSATRGEVVAAVKTLKEGSKEEDRIKFLQEAAIMGQFKHPNVVEMYGVVTQGEPVSTHRQALSKALAALLVCRPASKHYTTSRHNSQCHISICVMSHCHTYSSIFAFITVDPYQFKVDPAT
jgi:serine/threonine protein kinase